MPAHAPAPAPPPLPLPARLPWRRRCPPLSAPLPPAAAPRRTRARACISAPASPLSLPPPHLPLLPLLPLPTRAARVWMHRSLGCGGREGGEGLAGVGEAAVGDCTLRAQRRAALPRGRRPPLRRPPARMGAGRRRAVQPPTRGARGLAPRGGGGWSCAGRRGSPGRRKRCAERDARAGAYDTAVLTVRRGAGCVVWAGARGAPGRARHGPRARPPLACDTPIA